MKILKVVCCVPPEGGDCHVREESNCTREGKVYPIDKHTFSWLCSGTGKQYYHDYSKLFNFIEWSKVSLIGYRWFMEKTCD